MLEYWKETRDIQKRIKAVQERSRKRADVESAEMIGYAVANDRFEIDRLKGQLELIDTKRWMNRAIKHGIIVSASDDYWETNKATELDYLTSEGKAFIKDSIAERKALFWKRWSPMITILISVLSLMVAITALWKSS